jgi:DNA mismatch endonuclease, patch repair protein
MSAESWASSAAVARSMRSNRRRDTTPELEVRRILFARGLRYRVDFAPGINKRRRADVVFTTFRVAVFIDGCFWHGCRLHATVPRTNVDYWIPKLARNVARDMDTTAQLVDQGWSVLRYWEHEGAEAIADDICKRVAALSGIPPTPSPPLA